MAPYGSISSPPKKDAEMVDEIPASVIVFARSYVINDGTVLALQRARANRHNPLLWEVPGGKINHGQNLYDALKRELEEETGLLIKPLDSIFHYEGRLMRGGRHNGKTYVALFGISIIVGGKLRLSEEHLTYRWSTYAQLTNLKLTPETKKATEALANRLREIGVK